MENLKSPIKRVLINSIDYTQVGAYYDSVAAVNVLSFKQYGVNIPYVAAAFKGAKSCTDNGTVQSMELEISKACPCSDCDWQYGIRLVKKVKDPGVNNNESNYMGKSYDGTISKVTCTGGLIDDTYLLQAEDDIITQVYADTGLHNDNPDPVTGGGAIAYAVRSYKVTATLFNTNKLNFTYAGATNTIIMNTGATIISMCLDLNGDATFAAHARAVAISATEISIYGLTGADLFTIADGAGATTLTINYRRIWLYSKSPKVKFAVQFDFGFATLYNRSLYVLDGANAAAVANSGLTVTINGTANNVGTNVATVTLVAAAINAVGGITGAGVYATVIGNVGTGKIYINGTDAVETLRVIPSLSPANYATYTAASAYILDTTVYNSTAGGTFPILTGEEVFKLLAAQPDSGSLAIWDGADRPDPTADYCSYFFQLDSSIFAIHGASHMDNYRGVVEVFVKKSIVSTAFLYPGVNAVALSAQLGSLNAAPTTTATVTLEALFQLWAGIGTIAQTGVVTGGSNPNAWTN